MSLIRRPRARLKPPSEPLIHASIEPLAATPEQALQEICSPTGEIQRSVEGDDGKPDILLRIIDLSRRILAEPESLRTPIIFMGAYKLLLQTILSHLAQDGCSMDPAFEKWLDAQLDSYSEVFKVSVTQSTGSRFKPAGGGSGIFSNARNFIINGGSFISHPPDKNYQLLRKEIRSMSDGNSAVLLNDIVRLQETSEMTLQAVRIIIVLFF